MFARAVPALWVVLISILGHTTAEKPRYAVAIIDGKRMRVRDDRQPSLFTADYGDCLGKSAINVTRFDAAYYKDNMTIIFHLAGETTFVKEDIMMNIGVFAYGESRFDLTFNPCDANIRSACPVKSGIPIEAAGIIPVNQDDVAGIPDLALSIPDFEGQAILKIFSNSTRKEIGCFAAQITNGNTFRQAAIVGPVLGVVTILAVLASSVSALYGDNIIEIRKHYAHSLSISVLFAVWHHIFFSGALSMNWPSVLVAFWSNYAWTGGMVYAENMQNMIDSFVGLRKASTSHVGTAGTEAAGPGLESAYTLNQIYDRDSIPVITTPGVLFTKRHLVDATDGFQYYGQQVRPGLPLPGNYSGFAGVLAQERIPTSNAFMTGFLWLLMLVAVVGSISVSFKLVLEGLTRLDLISRKWFMFFRIHFWRYLAATLLRTLFISFFMMAFLAMFQFSYLGVAGPVSVACVVFVVVVFGLGSIAAFAYYSRLDFSTNRFSSDRLNIGTRRVLKIFPWYTVARQSKQGTTEDQVHVISIPWWKLAPKQHQKSIHDDESFIKTFGWLASRYRRTRWWFFIVWLVYEFTRACFLAGASGRPVVQVLGLLAVELVAFALMISMRPFEGQRLNVLLVYLLGFSKISTAALSAAFDTRLGLARIPATVIGLIIIVVQGLLTIAALVAVIIGIITSYLSVMRNREDIRPRSWRSWRKRYMDKIDFEAQDIPRPRLEPRPMPTLLEVSKDRSFHVKHVRRMAKVEDEDVDFMQGTYIGPSVSRLAPSISNTAQKPGSPTHQDRAVSLQSQTSNSSLPRAARLYRANWNMHDYSDGQRRGCHRTRSSALTTTLGQPEFLPSRVTPYSASLANKANLNEPKPTRPDRSRSDTPELLLEQGEAGSNDRPSSGATDEKLTSPSRAT